MLAWARGHRAQKLVAKETLNHRALIEMVSGLDVYQHTAEAYRRAYRALGIDIVNRVPLRNAPEPIPEGTSLPHQSKPYNLAHLGVYDTAMRHTFACAAPEEVWNLDLDAIRYEDLVTPVPHPCRADDIRARQSAIGEIGLYYPMLYTMLFMWGVEVLGWEVFMMAAALRPDQFHEHFILPCVAKSKVIVKEIADASDSPFIFVHDDLASASGPMFRPGWYDEYIFPHYPEIWSEAKRMGKKIILVADGDMSVFLSKLVEVGVDGIMFETPTTPLEAVIEHFGEAGRFFIGGIDTAQLTFGSPEDVRTMVLDLYARARGCPGFAVASGGGIHNGVPLSNLEAYFDARAEIGANLADWRRISHVAVNGE